jgi:tetratricopeptide (TPR) repeat protein
MRSLSLLLVLVAATAAADITPAQRKAANDAFARGDWAAVAKAYEALAAVEHHPAQYGRLGMALVELGKASEAVPHLESSLATIPNPRVALYLARAKAKLGDATGAFAALDKMIKFGGVPVAAVRDAREFAALARDKRFQDALKNDLAAVEPCRAAPEFRQFDFWIGDWTVTDAKGNTAGSSKVELMLGSCVMLENWTGGNGSGKSFNIYDATDKKWHQTWVDDRGTFTHYIGGMVNGAMVITAEHAPNGQPGLARMTYSKLAEGKVRQHGESSTDGGKTWTTTFDLTYTKR